MSTRGRLEGTRLIISCAATPSSHAYCGSRTTGARRRLLEGEEHSANRTHAPGDRSRAQAISLAFAPTPHLEHRMSLSALQESSDEKLCAPSERAKPMEAPQQPSSLEAGEREASTVQSEAATRIIEESEEFSWPPVEPSQGNSAPPPQATLTHTLSPPEDGELEPTDRCGVAAQERVPLVAPLSTEELASELRQRAAYYIPELEQEAERFQAELAQARHASQQQTVARRAFGYGTRLGNRATATANTTATAATAATATLAAKVLTCCVARK